MCKRNLAQDRPRVVETPASSPGLPPARMPTADGASVGLGLSPFSENGVGLSQTVFHLLIPAVTLSAACS